MTEPKDLLKTNTKMLQILIDGQSSMQGEIIKLRQEMKDEFKKTNLRIDSLGAEIAAIDDDAPTGEEFYKLKRRVRKLEMKLSN